MKDRIYISIKLRFQFFIICWKFHMLDLQLINIQSVSNTLYMCLGYIHDSGNDLKIHLYKWLIY
jgi:hypothetical protein